MMVPRRPVPGALRMIELRPNLAKFLHIARRWQGQNQRRCRAWQANLKRARTKSQDYRSPRHFRRPARIGYAPSSRNLKKQTMTRADAIARARDDFKSGAFLAELDRRVAFKTESQNPSRGPELHAYLEQEMMPAFAALDFTSRLVESPGGKAPFLFAEHHESAAMPTVLIYGHGDVVDGMEGEWREGRDPWRTTVAGARLYGRGTADNK